MSKTKKTTKKAVKLTAIEQKRVTVLKDALAQIRAQKYYVASGTGYVGRGGENPFDNYNFEAAAESCELLLGKKAKDVELNKFLDKIITPKAPCQVCAKGAMLISSIRKFNNFSLQDVVDTDLDDLASDEGTYEIFGRENADKMEEYFECNDAAVNEHGEEYDPYNGDQDSKDFKQWSDTYPNSEDRLIAIFENAIKNKGTFKP